MRSCGFFISIESCILWSLIQKSSSFFFVFIVFWVIGKFNKSVVWMCLICFLISNILLWIWLAGSIRNQKLSWSLFFSKSSTSVLSLDSVSINLEIWSAWLVCIVSILSILVGYMKFQMMFDLVIYYLLNACIFFLFLIFLIINFFY